MNSGDEDVEDVGCTDDEKYDFVGTEEYKEYVENFVVHSPPRSQLS